MEQHPTPSPAQARVRVPPIGRGNWVRENAEGRTIRSIVFEYNGRPPHWQFGELTVSAPVFKHWNEVDIRAIDMSVGFIIRE